jgi:hypothetical protein
MPSEPTPEETIEIVRRVLAHPAAAKLIELDTWGHAKGLKSEDRTTIVNEISTFYTKCFSSDVGKEYVAKVAFIVRKDSMMMMLGLQKWAVEKSIPEASCQQLLNAIMTFYVQVTPQTAESMTIACEYVEKAAEIVAALGPAIVGTLREAT